MYTQGTSLTIPYLIITIILLQSIGPITALGQQNSWTILLYIAADNDLEPAALIDLDEIELGLANGGPGVTVVAFVDRSAQDFEYGEFPPQIAEVIENTPQWDGARILLMEPDTRAGVVSRFMDEWGEVNTGDPRILASFIEYGVRNYPADRYALIIWDHGGGPGFFASDYSERDQITLKELSETLAQVNVHFDIIGFDACLMGSIETAYEVRKYADYLVASEETEPNLGWPYDTIIARIASNPSMSARDVVNMIVDEYIKSYQQVQIPGVTLSAIDLSIYRDNRFLQEVRAFINDAKQDLDTVKNARATVQEFGGGDDPASGANQIDVIDLLESVGGRMASAGRLKTLIESSIINSGSYGDSVARAKGLSIHYPLRYSKEIYVELTSFSTDSGWAGFLEEAVNVEASLEAPQTGGGAGEIELLKLFNGMGLEYSEWSAAGPVDFDGDGAHEFIVYGLGYDRDTGEVSIDLSISKYIEGSLREVYTDTIDWGYPDEEGNSPFVMADAMSGDVDGDGMEEFFDAYSYVDPYYVYTNIDRYDFDGSSGVESLFTTIDNLVVTSSDLGDLAGDGHFDIILGGYEVDTDTGNIEGSLYILSADTLEVEGSFTLDAPQGSLVDVPGIALGEMSPERGDEIALVYNIYRVDQETGSIEPLAFRLAVMSVEGGKLRIIDGIEYDGFASSLDAGDIDSDGQYEVIIVYMQPDGGHLEILEIQNQGIVSLGRWKFGVSQQGIAVAEAYDIDGDGIVEIMMAVAEPQEEGVEAVLEIYAYVSSTGDLKPENRLNFGAEHIIPVPADLNGDGRLEVVYLVQLKDGVYLGAGEVENYVNPTGDVEGQLLDSNGDPVPGAKVKLMLPRSVSIKTVTDENGRFSFKGVPAGTYQIEAYWRADGITHHATQLVRIEAGQVVQVILQERAQAPEQPETTTTSITEPTTTTTQTPITTTITTTQVVTETQTQETTTTATTTEETTVTHTMTITQTITQTTQQTVSATQQTTLQEEIQQQQTSETVIQQQSTQTTETRPNTTTTANTTTSTSIKQEGGQAETGEGIPLLAIQVVILILLVVAYLWIRSRKGVAVAIILALLLLNPVAIYVKAQEQPWWIYEGLRVTYVITSSIASINPWAKMQQTLGQMTVLGVEGGEPVTYPEKPNKVSTISGIDIYIAREPARGYVDLDEYLWLIHEAKVLEDTKRELNLRVVPQHGILNGPFWIDSRLLRDARAGSVVEIPGEGRIIRYNVLYTGRVDISPESTGPDSLLGVTGIALLLPVPPGTYRDIVVLQARLPSNQQQGNVNQAGDTWHELVVDRRLGLIYMEALISSQQGGQQQDTSIKKKSLYVRALSEITLDLEDKLPPYTEYRQQQLLHPGYHVAYMSMGILSGSLTSVGFSYWASIKGVYKDTMYMYETIFVSFNENYHQEIAAWKININTGNAEVLKVTVFASTISNEPLFRMEGQKVSHTYMWIGGDIGRGELEIMGHKYKRVTARSGPGDGDIEIYTYTLAEDTESSFEIAQLYYLPNGLLYAIEPTFNDISLSEALAQTGVIFRGSTLQVMKDVPNTQPRPVQEPGPEAATTTQQTAQNQGGELQTPQPTHATTNHTQAPAIHETVTKTETVTVTQTIGQQQNPQGEAAQSQGDGTGIASTMVTLATVIVAVLIIRELLRR